MKFKEVILCEKGTQAKVFVKILNLNKVKKIGKFPVVFYNETSGIACVHQSGHLLEQCPPETYEPRLARDKQGWDTSLLPVIPALGKWKLRIKSDKNNAFFDERIKALFAGIKFAMVDNGTPDEISIAVDNDKEGELLGWEVLDYFNLLKHPNISRLIYSANTEEGIMKAYKSKQPGAKWFTRYQAGLARSYADWISGMNMTIALTAENKGVLPPFQPLNAGRVIFAITHIIGLRHQEIETFVPQDYFNEHVWFKTSKGEPYKAKLLYPEAWLKGEPPRMVDDAKANAVHLELLKLPTGVISRYEQSTKQKKPPIGFHRTGFERFMIKKHSVGLDPLGDALQSLYSEKALITYPRVEVEHLDMSMHSAMPEYMGAILANLMSCTQLSENEKAFYKTAYEKVNLDAKSSIWVSGVDEKEAHHAIIPTNLKRTLHDLSALEFLVYREICDRLIVQFMPDYEYASTLITTDITLKSTVFSCVTSGTTPIALGWKSLTVEDEPLDGNEDDAGNLPMLTINEQVKTSEAKIFKETTKCPKMYTEDELLGDMESPGKFTTNKELLKKIKKLQIGTGGTRRSHVKDLKTKGFVEHVEEGKGKRKKTYLKPTEKLHALNRIAPDYFKLPETSAYWEDAFNSIQDGELTVAQFMDRQIKIMNRFMQELDQGKFKITNAINEKAVKCEVSNCGGYAFPCISKKGKPYWSCAACGTRHFDDNGAPGNVIGDNSGLVAPPPTRKESDPHHKCAACKKGKAYFKAIPGKKFDLWTCDGCGAAFFDKDGQLGTQLKGK